MDPKKVRMLERTVFRTHVKESTVTCYPPLAEWTAEAKRGCLTPHSTKSGKHLTTGNAFNSVFKNNWMSFYIKNICTKEKLDFFSRKATKINWLFTLPNHPCPISFRYSRLWRLRSDDFSSWTERKQEKDIMIDQNRRGLTEEKNWD